MTLAERSINDHTVGQLRNLAEQQSDQVRRQYWPRRAFPIDPVAVARSMGVEVFNADLGDDVFGMIRGSVGGADIFVDNDQPPNRYRFTVAHELGHFVQHQQFPEQRLEAYIDRRSDEDSGTAPEIYANQFAGALLMPRTELTRVEALDLSRWEMADYFGVSAEALSYRRRLVASSAR